MDLTTSAIIFVTFLVAIYFNYKFGFRQGVRGGHLVGIHETVEFLMKNGYIAAQRDGDDSKEKRVSVEELTFFIDTKLHEQRLKKAGIAV
jgi:hypothetical protein